MDYRDVLKTVLYGLLLMGIYYSTFSWLLTKDWTREDYSYGWLIPVVVLYILWDQRKRLQNILSNASWVGVFVLFMGLVVYFTGELSGEFFALYFSFWVVVLGLCWMHLGWKKLKSILFALIIMLAMFPLPHFINNKLTFQLKLVSSQLGVYLMRLYGMSAYREGNVIDLGFTQLQVVDACSGLRYFFPLIIVGLLLAYFYRAAFWKRAVIVISTVPLSIISNSIRIAVTGILYELWGAKVAEGFFHGFSGWFLFMFTLAVLLIEMKLLTLIWKESTAGKTSKGETLSSEEPTASSGQAEQGDSTSPPHIHHSKLKIKNFFSPPQFIVGVVLLALTLAISQGVEFREKIPISKPFHTFPKQIGQWSGMPQAMEQKFIDTLDLSDYVIVDYKNPASQSVNFYVAYYETQSKGESIHSPATCLPGSGWEFKQAGKAVLDLSEQGQGFMPVNRAFMQKGATRQLSYYWFPMRGRVLTNAYQMKIFNFWDALTRQRTDGALVRVMTPVFEYEKVEDADKRLQAFVKDVVPVLDEFLPQ